MYSVRYLPVLIMSKAVHLEEVDFIKGLAAISVIFLHTLPLSILKGTFAVFHIWQSVPLFLFITFYLGFRNLDKKEDVFRGYYSNDRLWKIFLKIWLPLLILAVIETAFFLVVGTKEKAIGCLLCYNNGPGSYYVWCYMQIWLLMPAIYLLLNWSGIAGGGILLILGVLLDFLWERYFDLKPGYTCFRYLFISVPAFMYLKGVNVKSLSPLIFFSMFYLVLMLYSTIPLYADPLLPDGWEAQTSLGYFYTLSLFLLLYKLYTKLKNSKLKQYITHVGTISWEVFLVQMVLIGSGVLNAVSLRLFDFAYFQIPFTIIATLSITLLFAEMYKKMLDRLFKIL